MIKYVIGDATQPQVQGRVVIAHVCNQLGRWGAGFVLSLSKRYPGAEIAYRGLPKWDLGTTQFSHVSHETFVANMIAQTRIGYDPGNKIDLPSLEKCLTVVKDWAIDQKATVHMPRIGAGLGGCPWDVTESMLKKVFNGKVEVTVYDLPKVTV